MRKLITIIIIIALALVGWYAWQRKTVTKTPEITVQPALSKPDASNATFAFDDGPVTLQDGTASEPPLETDLTNDIAYGDVNSDGKNDAAVLLVQTGGGSGEFIYVAAYVSGNVAYKGSNTVFIGDRISPQSISIEPDGSIKVVYLDRKPSEPMSAEPTVSTTKYYAFRSGNLEER